MSLSTFSKNLRHLRKDKSLSQNQLAKRLFSSRSVVAKLETGRLSPNLVIVERSCKLFEVDILTMTTIDLTAA